MTIFREYFYQYESAIQGDHNMNTVDGANYGCSRPMSPAFTWFWPIVVQVVCTKVYKPSVFAHPSSVRGRYLTCTTRSYCLQIRLYPMYQRTPFTDRNITGGRLLLPLHLGFSITGLCILLNINKLVLMVRVTTIKNPKYLIARYTYQCPRKENKQATRAIRPIGPYKVGKARNTYWSGLR